MRAEKPKTVDEYIALQPVENQSKLIQLREAIIKTAPMATEMISYGMPSYRINYQLAYFAAHKSHIGLYPIPSQAPELKKDLAPYITSKATARFSYDKPLPITLIKRVVKYMVKRDEALNKARLLKKAAKKKIKK